MRGGRLGSTIVGGGRLGVKNCGRWEIGGQKLWEVGDGHPCVTPLLRIPHNWQEMRLIVLIAAHLLSFQL